MSSIVKKVAIVLIALSLLFYAASSAFAWYEHGRFSEETDNAYIKADTVAIRPEISGRIELVAVQENQRVHKGQLLIQIDAGDYQAKVKQALAQLAVSHAALANTDAQFLLQDKKLDEATANIDAANAELHRSELELKRFKVLESQSFDSRQQLQNAEAAVEVARAKVAQATAAKAAAKQMLTVLEAQRSSAEAQIEVVQSELDFSQNQLAKTAIVAPGDGIIGNLGARVGSSAQPNMTLLYLVPLAKIYVVANYKETQITHMSIGQPVKLKVDSQPEIKYTGVVESLAPSTGTEFSLLPADNATGNFNKIVQRVPVRIRITGPDNALSMLRPGLSVVPSVDTQSFSQQVSYLDTPVMGSSVPANY
ncbi:HlyD family secretion protein [Paraglaciecola arctica]|uniref:Multidrug resistance protein A n=1 Tax=Paraglaciecola arctica BSs20135 TaxID=493475 RepID=K6XJW7_9ALTE|nr:HlyD family secretion protein [Paraglaciecola arctica]GAC20954.1 multidrug resistance protein A [Paraglaciecola arctica BSs20135]